MFRFRRLALELDCAVETIVWDIFVENWPCDYDPESDQLYWPGDFEDDHRDEQEADGYGFNPVGDCE